MLFSYLLHLLPTLASMQNLTTFLWPWSQLCLTSVSPVSSTHGVSLTLTLSGSRMASCQLLLFWGLLFPMYSSHPTCILCAQPHHAYPHQVPSGQISTQTPLDHMSDSSRSPHPTSPGLGPLCCQYRAAQLSVTIPEPVLQVLLALENDPFCHTSNKSLDYSGICFHICNTGVGQS